MGRRDNSATSAGPSVSNLDPRDDDPKCIATHNQSEMSFFLYRRSLLPMYLPRCTAAHWVDVDWFGEFRLTIASDKHGALPPSRSPRCKSHTLTSVFRTDYSWHYWTVIHHNFLLLNFCSEMLGGRSMVAHLTRWSCRIWSHELGFTLTGSLPCFIYIYMSATPYTTGVYFLFKRDAPFPPSRIQHLILPSSLFRHANITSYV